MKTQNAVILKHLQTHKKGIEPMTALNRYGCFRLASRINDLRNAGNNITTTMVYDKKTGKHYARYTLEA